MIMKFSKAENPHNYWVFNGHLVRIHSGFRVSPVMTASIPLHRQIELYLTAAKKAMRFPGAGGRCRAAAYMAVTLPGRAEYDAIWHGTHRVHHDD